MTSWSNFSEVIDDFKIKVYTFNHIAETNIITIANKLDMSYDFYIKHNMHTVERKINTVINKNKNLIKSTSKTFKLSIEPWTTARKPVDIAKKVQVDISSASNMNSHFYLLAAHQRTQRPDPADATLNLSHNIFNNAIFDHVKVRKYYSEIDGVRYPKNQIMNNYDENSYLDQYRELKLCYKACVVEPMLSPIVTYDKMKKYYPFRTNDLRFQVDHISPKKTRIFEEYDDNPDNILMYIILTKHR